MSPVVIGLALFAAILHATWNAFLRTGADRLWTVTVMSFSSTIVALPFVFFYPFPASSTWLYIVLSAFLQVGYSVFLVAAYKNGELGQVYPIVRGSVPLLVTLGGFLIANERLNAYQSAGVILVAAGIISLSFGKGRAGISSILFALATGAIIAGYATVDAIGVRDCSTYRRLHSVGAGALRCFAADNVHHGARKACRGFSLARNLESTGRRDCRCHGLCRGGGGIRSRAGRPYHGIARDERRVRGADRMAVPR